MNPQHVHLCTAYFHICKYEWHSYLNLIVHVITYFRHALWKKQVPQAASTGTFLYRQRILSSVSSVLSAHQTNQCVACQCNYVHENTRINKDIYIYIYVCVYIYIYLYIYIYIYIYIHIYIHTNIWTCICVQISMHFAFMYVGLYLDLNLYDYVIIHKYIRVNVYMKI